MYDPDVMRSLVNDRIDERHRRADARRLGRPARRRRRRGMRALLVLGSRS